MPLPAHVQLVGPVRLNTFAAVLLAAVALAVWLAGRRLRRTDPQAVGPVRDALLAAAVVGLVCARLANQWVAPDIDWSQPGTWLRLNGTDLAWAGGLAEGVVLFAWLLRRRGLDWQAAADRVAPAVAWAVALGWLGFPLVGRPTDGAWGLALAPGVAVHPVQLYGAAGFAGLGWLLAWQQGRLAFPGQNLTTFIALASALRILIGFFLPGDAFVGPWTAAQAADAALLAASLLWARALAASRQEAGS